MGAEVATYDFFLALMCGVRLEGVERFGYREPDFSEAVAAGFAVLEGMEFDLNFAVIPHYIHRTSATAFRGIQMVHSVAVFAAPYYDLITVVIGVASARDLIADLPLDEAQCREIAQAFLETYNQRPART